MVMHCLPELEKLFSIKGYEILHYIEPNVCFYYPDIVIINYKKNVFDNWQRARNGLGFDDLKILHQIYLNVNNNIINTFRKLNNMLGFTTTFLKKSITKLNNAEIVDVIEGKIIIPKSLDNIFGIRDIIAVEAKIGNHKVAFSQARLNYWFASESYVLFPEIKLEKTIKNLLENERYLGVGVFEYKKFDIKLHRKSRVNKLPESYFSWVFNEAIGTMLYNKGL